jgi:uncharacterized protein (TIGR00730 family)
VATSSSPVEIAVIGSARIGPGDSRYDEALQLGGELADAGWTVITGGYGGLMGATATGAAARGGHTIGLPMRPWEHLTPHDSHAELRWSEDYAERMRHLLRARIVVGLPGGVGTLAEASSVWAAVQTEPGSASLVLVGAGWSRLLDAFARELVVDEADVALAHAVSSIHEVVPVIRRLLEHPDAQLSARG